MDSAKSIGATKPNPLAGAGTLSQLGGGEERRRSQRVLLRVPAIIHVALQGKPVTLGATTLSVNAHGAMVVVNENLVAETRLILEHNSTKERMACRVVRPPRDTPEGYQTAIEFDSPCPDFWKIAFPPVNWRADEP
jgi:hypothetical protein